MLEGKTDREEKIGPQKPRKRSPTVVAPHPTVVAPHKWGPTDRLLLHEPRNFILCVKELGMGKNVFRMLCFFHQVKNS